MPRPLKHASLLWAIMLIGFFILSLGLPRVNLASAQQATGSIPTVTGTPIGPYITVNLDQFFINVRSGPSSFFYPRIGILMRGESAPALGRSPDGSWIQIYYPGVPGDIGWVYAANVQLTSQLLLPVVEAPPTATLIAPTLNPTLLAEFLPAQTATRPATFTPAPRLEPPVFTDVSPSATRLPLGLVIFGFGFVGLLVAAISFLRGR